VVVIVESTEGLTPRALARAAGASAAPCDCAACCAAGEAASPLLTTVTSAATDSSVVLAPLRAAGATPSAVAIALVLSEGAARLPPLVALSSRVTVNDALPDSARAACRLRREGGLALTRHVVGSAWQMSS